MSTDAQDTQSDDGIEASRRHLRLALELIGKHKLPTDPINYHIWYDYASGKNGELNAAIERHLESGRLFSAEVSRQIFSQYVAGDGEVMANLVREELKKVFAEVMGAIQSTDKQFSESEGKLETIQASLFPGLTEAVLEKLVNQVKNEIGGLKFTSGSFKEQLEQASLEIEHLKTKVTQYRDEALKDPLTQISNRRGFDQTLQGTVDEANLAQTPLCLIMTDIDHFKRINDTHGHLVGDNVIRMVAGAIKESIKGRDLAARIGGEEFAIILPETPFDGAMKLADNLRLTFERLDFKKKTTGQSLGKITLSFGVTGYKLGETAENFVRRADQALYRSKNTGRNKVSGL